MLICREQNAKVPALHLDKTINYKVSENTGYFLLYMLENSNSCAGQNDITIYRVDFNKKNSKEKFLILRQPNLLLFLISPK